MSICYDVMPDGGYHQVIAWGTLRVADLVCDVTSHLQDKCTGQCDIRSTIIDKPVLCIGYTHSQDCNTQRQEATVLLVCYMNVAE